MALGVSDFIHQPLVSDAVATARLACEAKAISDLVDDQGHQYVDLVMEGGGVLGIALVGYTYVLEQVGIRFLGVGGTSAGAINATLTAGVADPAEAKTELILPMLSKLEMFSFVDGDDDATDFVRALVKKAGPIRMAWKGWQVIDNLRDDLGLNPGDVFEKWLAQQLRDCGVTTTAELVARMNRLPVIKHRQGDALVPLKPGSISPKLKIVTAEVCTRSRVTFPEMAPLFWHDPREVSPARFARCSMSIPYFFEPVTIDDLPRGSEADRMWNEYVRFEGGVPDEAVFVDGGILSNFPINQFHVEGRVPRAPTLGVKLGNDREEPQAVKGPLSLFGGVFSAARQCLDLDFFLRHPDYRHLVGTISTGATHTVGTGKYAKGHNWLDFFLEDDAKVDLFVRGAQAAAAFLQDFDWESYKEIRRSLIAPAVRAAPAPLGQPQPGA